MINVSSEFILMRIGDSNGRVMSSGSFVYLIQEKRGGSVLDLAFCHLSNFLSFDLL